MLFVSISRPELLQMPLDPSVGYEFRLDLFPKIDLLWLQTFLQQTTCPVLLTLRKRGQGGKFQETEAERESLIHQLLRLEPSYFDLEADMRASFLQEVMQIYPKTKIILSYHNLQEVPSDLESIYQKMAAYPVFSYKIAAFVHSSSEALQLLLFAKAHPKVSAICLGEKGSFARVLGPIVGNVVNYASASSLEATAPGQIPFEELISVYRYFSLNPSTEIYGLIGDPVMQSPGALYHNGVFQKRGHNAVYVKMTVRAEELPAFIPLAKQLGIRGLSVTTPLKEAILPWIDGWEADAKQIGAINTLRFEKGKICGTNTDGPGALDALEQKGAVHGKKVVLLGAGGAARGIAFEAIQRGAHVSIFNRTLAKAEKMALDLGCEAGGLDEMDVDADVVIQCTAEPIEMECKPEMIAMDIVYHPKETPFLKRALEKGCSVIYGEEMFLRQAERQTAFWIGQP